MLLLHVSELNSRTPTFAILIESDHVTLTSFLKNVLVNLHKHLRYI